MTVGELVLTAGWVMAPIVLCSVVACLVFLQKVLQFRAARLDDWGWLDEVLARAEAGELTAAAEASAGVAHHPGARVVEATARTLLRRPGRAEAEARRVGSQQLQSLEGYLALLAFVAQAAPLLGLFGTVVGMVELFLGLEGSGLRDVDVSLLSAGIWKALLTTAAGLLVAVPTLAGHAFLASRADGFRLAVADAVERLITAAHPETPAEDAER